MKRLIILAICVIALAIAGYMFFLSGRSHELTITQSQIETALRQRFPVSKTYFRFFKVTYSNPTARLLPDTKRIEVCLEAELEVDFVVKSVKLGSRASATAGITYRNATHEFYLSNPQINRLTFQWVPQAGVDAVGDLAKMTADKLDTFGISTERIAQVAESASALAVERLQQFPVHTLNGKDANSATAKMILKNVEVRGNELHVTLGR